MKTTEYAYLSDAFRNLDLTERMAFQGIDDSLGEAQAADLRIDSQEALLIIDDRGFEIHQMPDTVDGPDAFNPITWAHRPGDAMTHGLIGSDRTSLEIFANYIAEKGRATRCGLTSSELAAYGLEKVC